MTAVFKDCRLWLLMLLVFCVTVRAEDELPEEPPGEFFPLRAEDHRDAASFERGQPVVGTTYFYWYDIDSGGHIVDRDGTDALTTHPADMNNVSYKRASWHREQLEDMLGGEMALAISKVKVTRTVSEGEK